MTELYQRFISSLQYQANVTCGVFIAAAVILLATWAMMQNTFTRKWILPVWVGYLILMYVGALLYGVYGHL
jgi:hypothetical protein